MVILRAINKIAINGYMQAVSKIGKAIKMIGRAINRLDISDE